MPGPPNKPIDSVVAIKEGKVRTFAEGLWAVMGLEWIDRTLYVVHAPFLSAFTDTDGDGRADRRVDLMTGLGPANPAFSGINDHIASGVRLGIDGFLYIAVGDKGIPRGVGKDGTTIRMKGGGVIRIRPDGTDLEVVSTGERNPLSVALTDRDEIFTYGNDDDSHRWPNSLTHHIVGGHYGYPYEFLTAPWRCLPVMSGQIGGAGAQAIIYNEDGLATTYQGNLLACDWGLQAVFRYELAKAGATFKVVKREPLVTKGSLGDFRPFSIAVDADRNALILVDWAYNGWLADGPKTGRLYRLRYQGKDKVTTRTRSLCGFMDPRRPGGFSTSIIRPRCASRRPRASQRHPASIRGPVRAELLPEPRSPKRSSANGSSSQRDLDLGDGFEPDRLHALWALDAINSPHARASIRDALAHPAAEVRLQAARSSGIRRDAKAAPDLAKLLGDPDPAVRREAAIALGRIGDVSAAPLLYAALGQSDRVVAWSVRAAIRRPVRAWDADALHAALRDPKRRDEALALVDESWTFPAIDALNMAFAGETDPTVRSRIMANLAGQYRKYPEWSGAWFGTNPLAGAFPSKTVDWDRDAMQAILVSLARGLVDPAASVRRSAIVALTTIGPEASANLLAAVPREADATNRAAMIAALGRWGEPRALPMLGQILGAKDQPLALRVAALDALGGINSRQAFNLRFAIVFDPSAPPEPRRARGVARARTHGRPAAERPGRLPRRQAQARAGRRAAGLRDVAKLPPEVHEPDHRQARRSRFRCPQRRHRRRRPPPTGRGRPQVDPPGENRGDAVGRHRRPRRDARPSGPRRLPRRARRSQSGSASPRPVGPRADSRAGRSRVDAACRGRGVHRPLGAGRRAGADRLPPGRRLGASSARFRGRPRNSSSAITRSTSHGPIRVSRAGPSRGRPGPATPSSGASFLDDLKGGAASTLAARPTSPRSPMPRSPRIATATPSSSSAPAGRSRWRSTRRSSTTRRRSPDVPTRPIPTSSGSSSSRGRTGSWSGRARGSAPGRSASSLARPPRRSSRRSRGRAGSRRSARSP